MCKKEIVWVVTTLAVAAVAWFVYDSFVKEQNVDPGMAPQMSVSESVPADSSAGLEEPVGTTMDLGDLPSVGDDAE